MAVNYNFIKIKIEGIFIRNIKNTWYIPYKNSLNFY